jgi:TPP-dependent pyruvate/acetoin dehydrogenase alpha subunit
MTTKIISDNLPMSKDLMLEMYRRMVRIRKFELAASELFRRGQIKGTVHTYIGMEASGVGVCMALNQDDLIAGTHRSHGHNIAKGADVGKMMAEILGRETGYCKGRGGSMHIAAFETGSLGALAIVGSGIPIAVGAALGFKLRQEKCVSATFTGDAGCNTGNFHESMNMAALWKLPVLFVLENNHYGVSTNICESCSIQDLQTRASGYGIPGVKVDGFDVLKVYEAAGEAIKRARKGDGPSLLVTESYRLDGHYSGEPEVYRDRAEVDQFWKMEPIGRFSRHLVDNAIASEAEITQIELEEDQRIKQAIQFAKDSPEPDPATAMDYIYS